MMGTSGYPVWSPRLPKVVLTAQRRPVVADLIPQDDTTAPLIIYVEETTFTNAAATVAEGDPKPESTLILEQKESAVKKIATTLPITDEQLDDVPQLRAYVDQRLTLMLQLTEETKLLNGLGTTDILGFLQKPGTGATTRGTGEDNPDAILRAIADVNSITAFANASGVVLNPLQWLAIQLLRSTTGDYIWGHPSEKGPKTLWGLPVVETPAIADGKALVGDFRMYSHISRRMGIRIEVGYINEDFKNNIKRLRAEERLSLEIYRANAFNVISNLNKAA
jgi:HK97 family phage major capsid protein